MSGSEGDAGSGSEYRVSGADLVERLREILHEGNVRHVVIRNDRGRTILEMPLTLGAAGALFAPPWMAIGVLAALLGRCTIGVVREDPAPRGDGDPEQNA